MIASSAKVRPVLIPLRQASASRSSCPHVGKGFDLVRITVFCVPVNGPKVRSSQPPNPERPLDAQQAQKAEQRLKAEGLQAPN